MNNPADEAEFRARVQKLEGVLRDIEAAPESPLRGLALDAVQTLMAFHGAAVARMTDLVAAGGEPGQSILARFADDDLVSSLLLLYGLHPADFDTRVRQALEKAAPALKAHGASVELLGAAGSVVRLRVDRNGHGCQSTAGKIKSALEDAIYERAPEAAGVEIDGLSPAGSSSGFVPVEQLFGHHPGKSRRQQGEIDEIPKSTPSGTCCGNE